MHSLKSAGSFYYVSNRGYVIPVIQPDPPLKLNELVKIDGILYRIKGIEAFGSIDGDWPGHNIGVCVGDPNVGRYYEKL